MEFGCVFQKLFNKVCIAKTIVKDLDKSISQQVIQMNLFILQKCVSLKTSLPVNYFLRGR